MNPLQKGIANEAINSNSINALINCFFQNRSKSTVASYRQDLKQFCKFVQVKNLNEAIQLFLSKGSGPANLVAMNYKAHLIENDYAPATTNRRLSALRAVVQVARTIGLVNWNLEVENQRHEQYRDTKGIGIERIRHIIKSLTSRSDIISVRDLALIRLLYDLGLRRNEVIGIDVEDIDFEKSTILILGKGRVERQKLSLPEATKHAIQNWLTVRGNNHGPLFCPLDRANGNSIKRLTGTGLYKIAKKYGSSVHSYRHTAITECCKVIADNSLGVETLVAFSRHKSLNTAMIYMDHLGDKQSQLSKLVANQIKK